jgi:hypothetical protein
MKRNLIMDKVNQDETGKNTTGSQPHKDTSKKTGFDKNLKKIIVFFAFLSQSP